MYHILPAHHLSVQLNALEIKQTSSSLQRRTYRLHVDVVGNGIPRVPPRVVHGRLAFDREYDGACPPHGYGAVDLHTRT